MAKYMTEINGERGNIEVSENEMANEFPEEWSYEEALFYKLSKKVQGFDTKEPVEIDKLPNNLLDKVGSFVEIKIRREE